MRMINVFTVMRRLPSALYEATAANNCLNPSHNILPQHHNIWTIGSKSLTEALVVWDFALKSLSRCWHCVWTSGPNLPPQLLHHHPLNLLSASIWREGDLGWLVWFRCYNLQKDVILHTAYHSTENLGGRFHEPKPLVDAWFRVA